MHLRDATRDDSAEILEIYNQVLRDSTAIYDDTPSTLEERQTWFEDRQEKGFPVFVVEDGGRVLGFGSYGPWRTRWGYRFTVEHSVHVHIDHRGKGVGAMLVRALIDHAKQAQMHVMVGGIDAENVNSIRFHEQLGFVEVGRAWQVARKFDRWLDLVTMQLFLQDGSVST